MIISRITLVMATLIALGLAPAAAQNEGLKRTVLQQADLTGIEGHQGTLYKVEIAPGAAVPKHTHPGDEFVYVAEGSLVIEPEGQPATTLTAGDSARAPMGLAHSARNADPAKPAVLIVFAVTETGKPLASTSE